ncbi:MAG: ABC transporter ATP-binding protein [Alphaproteobacteria bacterium]|nr:ABC transporter ATP-binding protein [Alphaproteobacteria bacterium]
MSALIHLDNVSVFGVDTHARAATLRQFFTRRGRLRPTRIPILNNITLSAKPGDRIGIFGMNGSGKSSLLKVISGNYTIHGGTRQVRGAMVPLIEMGAGFEDELSGRDNIKLSYAYRGKLHLYSPAIEAQIIEFSELAESIDLPLKTYSSGMRSRLSFASAIFQHPDILLLDEVFAAGDQGFIQKSTEAIRQKIDQSAITIMVSHSAQEMLNICNRFLLMHQGRIVAEGDGNALLEQYNRDILHISAQQQAHI